VRSGKLLLAPCIPVDWPSFEIFFKHASARYEILVENPHRVSRGVAHVELDGKRLPTGETHLVLADDGCTHRVRVILEKPDAMQGRPDVPESTTGRWN